MMRTLLVTFTCAFALISTSVYAVDPTGEEVVIRNEADKTFYEYRRGGEIVEIKVVPKYGKPYYLTPSDAKGAEDGQYIQSDAPDISVPSWVIFRW
tara:strand:+ start:890 stop:1177 length:288 start_codon:yes stop_codon:yes gene_type:complete